MNPAQHLLRGLIRGYQILISPIIRGSCRYAPSCSDYALESVTRHGTVKGIFLAIGRIARCHPWGHHGHDPVPRMFATFRHDRFLRFPSLNRGEDYHE